MAVQYIVSSSSSQSGPWTAVAGSPFASLTDTIGNLAPGTTYYFQFQAQDTVYGITGPATVIGPVTTTSTGSESPQGTRLTSTSGTITDSANGTWYLIAGTAPVGSLTTGAVTTTTVALSWTASSATALQVHHPNGTVDGVSVTVLLYWNHQVHRDDNSGWAFWNGTGWTPESGDPSQTNNTESPQGTVINPTNYTTVIIYDSALTSWRLAGSSSTALQVVHSGVTDTSTSKVILLLYWGRQVYYETSTQGWWVWNGASWVATSDPRQATAVESPDGHTVADTIRIIIDATLARWTLVSGTGLEVARNGVVDTTTANTTLLLYWDHVVYRSSATGWWYWTGNVWTAVTGDPRANQATWSPLDKSTSIVLDDSNLTASSVGIVPQSVRSTVGYTTGKYFFEIELLGLSLDIIVGIATSSFHLGTLLGSDANSVGFVSSTQSISYNGTILSNGSGSGAAGDIISCAVDLTNNLIWFTSPKMRANLFTFNNSAAANPGTGVGGLPFGSVASGESPDGTTVTTVNQQINASQTPGTAAPVGGPFDVWTLSGGVVNVNGAPAGYSAGVTELYYIGHYVYQTAPGANSLNVNPGWWQWSGGTWVDCQNPVTGVVPPSSTYFVAFNDDVGGASVNVNFGSEPFSQTIPTGFTAWTTGGQINTTNPPTFFDDFLASIPSLYNTRNTAAGGTWEPTFWYQTDGLTINSTWIANPFDPATPLPSLITASNSCLNLVTDNTPTALLSACGGNPFVGGQVTSSPPSGFRQLNGYFEMRAAMSAMPGVGYAFYLMNDATWPPELDICEIVTNSIGNYVVVGSVWNIDGTLPASNTFSDYSLDITQFHTYGLDWQPATCTFFYDRVQLFQCPTPSGYTTPLFPILGTSQAGFGPTITNSTLLPATFRVDYVQIWKTRPF